MNKNQERNQEKNLKLHVTDGHRIEFLTAQQIHDLLGVTKSHAYRWIKDPDSIPERQMELLRIKALGSLPGFDPGWYATPDGINSPSGRTICQNQLEQIEHILQFMFSTETREQEVADLKAQIEWLRKRLATPPTLRKYSAPKVIQFDHSTRKVQEG